MKILMKSKLRAIAAAVLCIQMLVSLMPAASYAARENSDSGTKTVRVGYFSYQNYMLGAENGAVKSGYAYELLCDISYVNNWKYEFVYGDFNALYPMLLNGEIDILPCLVYTEERAQQHLFSDEEIYLEQYFISTLDEKVPEFTGIEDLNGKKISSVSDCYQNQVFEKWAEANNVSMEMICTDSFDDSWNLVRDGKADYILNIDSATRDSGFTSLLEVGSASSKFAIAPGREDIRDELNYAVSKLYEINPFSLSRLKEKYLTDTLSSCKLSPEEMQWLEGRESIRIAGFKQDVPYTYTDQSGKVTGVYPEIFTSMLQKLGIPIKTEWILYNSLDEMHTALKKGTVDLVCPDFHNHYHAERAGIIVSGEIQSMNMGLLYANRTQEKNIRKIATPANRLGTYYIAEYYPASELIPCNTIDECIDAVNDGRADAALTHTTTLQNASAKYSNVYKIKTLALGCPVCFSTSHKNGQLLCIINRGLHLISDSELQSLELLHSPENNYELWNYIKNNKVLIIFIILAIVLIVVYALERNFASQKLKKNLDEITKQKEIIEKNEMELMAAKESANAASRAKSTFLFNMSHDIRTPMNAILGFTELAKKNLHDTERASEYLEKVDNASHHLLELINEVLDMSRIESGKMTLHEEPMNLTAASATTMEICTEAGRQHDITVELHRGEAGDLWIYGDEVRLNQIAMNIISNAIKYTNPGGRVDIWVNILDSTAETVSLELVVKDTGIGMSEDFVKKIFEPFERSASSTISGIQGTGLGMSIVKQLVELMNGTISVTSELGVGTAVDTKFVFRLAQPDTAGISADRKDRIDSFEGIRVLLVEDNEMNREIATEILTEKGILVETAEDGDIAVEKMEKATDGQFDLILMDIQMPRMNGYDATRAIRKLENPLAANIPIIAMTANAFEEDKQNALAAGMNAHIAKPIDVQKLFRTLSGILPY